MRLDAEEHACPDKDEGIYGLELQNFVNVAESGLIIDQAKNKHVPFR